MRVLGVRQVDLVERAAQLLDPLQRRRRTPSRTPGSMPPPVSCGGTPKRRPSRRSAVGSSIGSGQAGRGGVALVAPDHVAQQQRGVGHVAGQRAGLVERRGEGDHPVARDRAVGGLEPDDPAQRGGLADRAAGVGADRPRRRARPPPRRPSRPTSRPARVRRVPGVRDRPEARVLVRRAHRELVHVRLAEQRGARPRSGLRTRGRRVGRPVALEDPRRRPGSARPRCRTGP